MTESRTQKYYVRIGNRWFNDFKGLDSGEVVSTSKREDAEEFTDADDAHKIAADVGGEVFEEVVTVELRGPIPAPVGAVA